jgi:hypothetical protein
MNNLPPARIRFLTVCILAAAATLVGCKDDDTGLTPEQKIVRAFAAGNWSATSVLKDNVEQTEFFGFLISFTGTLSYSTSGGPNAIPFPATGTWELGSPATSQLILGAGNQNIATSYQLDNSTLTIQFSYQGNGFPNGRAKELDGQWQFVFTQD